MVGTWLVGWFVSLGALLFVCLLLCVLFWFGLCVAWFMFASLLLFTVWYGFYLVLFRDVVNSVVLLSFFLFYVYLFLYCVFVCSSLLCFAGCWCLFSWYILIALCWCCAVAYLFSSLFRFTFGTAWLVLFMLYLDCFISGYCVDCGNDVIVVCGFSLRFSLLFFALTWLLGVCLCLLLLVVCLFLVLYLLWFACGFVGLLMAYLRLFVWFTLFVGLAGCLDYFVCIVWMCVCFRLLFCLCDCFLWFARATFVFFLSICDWLHDLF